MLAGILVILAGWNSRAHAQCDPATAEAQRVRIERLLADQDWRAHLWNLGWGIGFGGAAVGQLVFAVRPQWAPIITVNDKMQKSLYISAGKAGLASVARLILPLRVTHPHIAPGTEPCAALAEAERALAVTARREKNSFWLNHIGSLVANISGALILGLGYHAWGQAALSLAVGYPVGLISIYTEPRAAWHANRSRSWVSGVSAAPLITPEFRGLAITGWF